jgi:putative transposase
VSWKATCPMEQRLKFIEDWKTHEVPIVRLCEAYGVSRKTGYKWIDRYELEGVAALSDRSRAPRTSPQATGGEVAEAFIHLRKKHPHWGPRKLLAWMAKFRPAVGRPAASTLGDLLKRQGLVADRRRRTRSPARTQPFAEIAAPNDTWCTDFKGEFRVGSGQYCYPLTLTDAHSRFLLRCTGLPSVETEGSKRVFSGAFSEFGLPRVIRSDNGTPFSVPVAGPGSLSRLAVYFIQLGIRPEWIAPGSPEQNGRHERMHWTLKQETALPARSTFEAQQSAFDRFRREYNFERPHEALGQEVPASVYRPSPRPLPRQVPDLAYPTSFAVRRVNRHGEIVWKGTRVFLSEVLVREPVGLEEQEDGTWDVCFGSLIFGVMGVKGTFVRRERSLWRPSSSTP